MERVDYIVVGDGYAALFFCHQLLKNGKSFKIFSEGKESASQVSAGIINPVVLKKFTSFWKAQEQIDFLKLTLKEIESYTGKNYFIEAPIHRIFHDENEKLLWQKKATSSDLKDFLSLDFDYLKDIKNEYGTGKVMQSARLNVKEFFGDLLDYLNRRDSLIREKFNYDLLQPNLSRYNNLHFEKIVFCEGMGVKDNPYFCDIAVIPNKGHHIKVKLSKGLKSDFTIKKKHFLFPLKADLWYYGGTYDRNQTHNEIDEDAVQQLKNGLSEFYYNDFHVEEVSFGFRPTVNDRRPILGHHQEYKNFYVFNGLGARGILNGCYFANHLFQHIENGTEIYPEVDLKRFS